MKIRILALFLLIACDKNYGQIKNANAVWIREDFVNAIDIINDSSELRDYTFPIIGFANLFKKASRY